MVWWKIINITAFGVIFKYIALDINGLINKWILLIMVIPRHLSYA